MNNSQINREWLRQALENPNFKEAVSRVKADLYVDWCEHAKDAMERDQIFHTQKALDALVNKMTNMAHAP